MKIRLPVTWEVCGFIEVEGESIDEVLESDTLSSILDEAKLPEKYDYVDGSFQLASDDAEWIRLFQDRSIIE